jgi:steroid delta-isomerase-like uncharacterized protein
MSDAENDNKALMRRWFEEFWNRGRQEVIAEVRSPDAVANGLDGGDTKSRGREPMERFQLNFREAFPDLRVEIQDMVAEGDRVAVRFTVSGTHLGAALGPQPTGHKINFECMVFARIAGGRIVESWNSIDRLRLLQQIGALPDTGLAADFLVTRR